MKKILYLIIITTILITGCINKIDDKGEIGVLNGITMTIKEDTLTRTGATIIITDTTGLNNIYGSSYRIDKKEDGIWQQAKIVIEGNYGFTLEGYHVDKNNKLEMKIDWEWLYGKLTEGQYRIVKDTSKIGEQTNHEFCVEFTIE